MTASALHAAGQVVIVMNHTNPDLSEVQIGYRAHVLHGGVAYEWDQVSFQVREILIPITGKHMARRLYYFGDGGAFSLLFFFFSFVCFSPLPLDVFQGGVCVFK